MSNAFSFLKYSMGRTSHWRHGLSERFTDPRNLRAAETLERLAKTPMRDVDPTLWEQVVPFLEARTPAACEALSATARHVEFSQFPADLTEFIEHLLDALYKPAANGTGQATSSREARS